MVKLKEFEQTDWDCFAGAESPNGSEPLVNYEIKVNGYDAYLVVDANSIYVGTIDWWPERPETEAGFYRWCPFAEGKTIAESLPLVINSEDLVVNHGFSQLF